MDTDSSPLPIPETPSQVLPPEPPPVSPPSPQPAPVAQAVVSDLPGRQKTNIRKFLIPGLILFIVFLLGSVLIFWKLRL